MWIKLTVIDEDGRRTEECPINMNTIITYAPIKNEKYPEARSVLYTNGVFIQTIPVIEKIEEIEAAIQGV